jgi:cell division protein FtsL
MLEKLQEKLTKVDKIYLIGAIAVGVTVTGAIIYFANKKTPGPSKKEPATPASQISSEPPKEYSPLVDQNELEEGNHDPTSP